MATTCQLIPMLAVGVKDGTGNALASGLVRFYDQGTTNPQTVYQDSAASSAYSQPVTLDAYGKKNVFAKFKCRIVVKTADDLTTLYDWDPATRRAPSRS